MKYLISIFGAAVGLLAILGGLSLESFLVERARFENAGCEDAQLGGASVFHTSWAVCASCGDQKLAHSCEVTSPTLGVGAEVELGIVADSLRGVATSRRVWRGGYLEAQFIICIPAEFLAHTTRRIWWQGFGQTLLSLTRLFSLVSQPNRGGCGRVLTVSGIHRQGKGAGLKTHAD